VAITDKTKGVSQLSGHVFGLSPKSTLMHPKSDIWCADYFIHWPLLSILV